MSNPLKIFITYAHKNKEAKDTLIECLAVIKKDGLISIWHDNEILPGDKWREEIFSTHLPDSDILLYLVSRASLDSENCNKELAGALNFKIRVIPIILESCDWQNHQLSDFQALPDGVVPINQWDHEDEGWQNVVDGIRKVVDKMQSQTDSTSGVFEDELLAELAFQQGNILMMLGQIDSAIEAYSHTIELDPNHIEPYNNRGAAYNIKGKFNCAITDFTKAIELKPNNATLYNNRAGVYIDKGNLGCAMLDCKKAMELDPYNAEAYNNRGLVHRGNKDYNRAILDFTKAIGLERDYATGYNNRGNVYSDMGNPKCAILDFNKAIKMKRDYADAYFNRGNVYRKKGDSGSAIADYTKVIDFKPNNARAHYYRGMAYAMKGNVDCAIKDLDKAIDLKPDYTEVYYYRGMVRLYLKKWKKAKSDLTIAKNMGLDIVALFSNRYESIADFENRSDIQLPEDIAAMLTPQQ